MFTMVTTTNTNRYICMYCIYCVIHMYECIIRPSIHQFLQRIILLCISSYMSVIITWDLVHHFQFRNDVYL